MPLNGIYPNSVLNDGKNTVLGFFIDHSHAEAIALWAQLMRSRESTEIFTRKVAISIGIEDEDPIITKVNRYSLIPP